MPDFGDIGRFKQRDVDQAAALAAAGSYNKLTSSVDAASAALADAIKRYGSMSSEAKKASEDLDNGTKALLGYRDALVLLQGEQFKTLKGMREMAVVTEKYAAMSSVGLNSLVKLTKEQATFNVVLQQTADRISMVPDGLGRSIDSLRAMQATLRMTREEMNKFGGSIRDAALSGVGPNQFAKLTRQLQNLRGHDQGLELAKGIGGLHLADIQASQSGDPKAFLRALQAQTSQESRDLLADLRASIGAAPGKSQRHLEALAGQEATVDSIRAAVAEAGMHASTVALENYLPLVVDGVRRGAVATERLLAVMLFAQGQNLVGSAGGMAGIKGFMMGPGGRRVGRAAGGLAAAGGLNAFGQMVQDTAEDEGDPKFHGGKFAKVAAMGVAGASIGSVVPGPGTALGGAIGLGAGLLMEYGKEIGEFWSKQLGIGKPKAVPPPKPQPGDADFLTAGEIGKAARFSEQDEARRGFRHGSLADSQRRFAETEMETRLAGGMDRGRAQETVRQQMAGADEEFTRRVQAAEVHRKEAERLLEVVEGQKKEAAGLGVAVNPDVVNRGEVLKAQLFDAANAKAGAFNDWLKVLANSMDNITHRIQKSAEYITVQAQKELVEARIEGAEILGMTPQEAAAAYGAKAGKSRQLADMLTATEKSQIEDLQAKRNQVLADPTLNAEQRKTAVGIIDKDILNVPVNAQKARNAALLEEVAALNRVVDGERRRIDVEQSLQQTQKDLVEYIGGSFQEITRINQQLIATKAQDLEVTRKQIAEMRKKPGMTEDNPELQNLIKKQAHDAAELFKQTIGVQKNFLEQALGQAFGTGGRGGSKFQPAIHDRAIFGEHAQIAGMALPGQVGLAQQRAQAMQGMFAGRRGGAANAGVAGGGAAAAPGGGVQPGQPAAGGAGGMVPGGAGAGQPQLAIAINLKLDNAMLRAEVAGVIQRNIQANVLVAGVPGAVARP